MADVVNVRIRTSKNQEIGKAIQEVKDTMASVNKAITESLMNDLKVISEKIKNGDKSHGTKS